MAKRIKASKWSPQGEMTIYRVAEQKNELMAVLETGNRITVDLSAVSEIDSAGLQLLILAKREADRQRKSLSIDAPSQAVQSAVEISGLAGVFGMSTILPAGG